MNIAYYTRRIMQELTNTGTSSVSTRHLSESTARSRLINAARRADVRITTEKRGDEIIARVRSTTQPQQGDTNMETFRIPRNNDVDLEFTGTKLADATSQTPTKTKWTEIRIYRTDSNKYVVETAGRSTDGSVNASFVTVLDRPEDMREALQRKDRVEYLTHVALDALKQASAVDTAIANALVERI